MNRPHINTLQPVSTSTTPALIADQLRARIVDGSLAPGMQLTEAHLSDRLGVSRGPVREAMQRLIQEGLLVNIRNRGVFVVELGPDDIADIYTARAAVERHAAALLRRARDPQTLDALDAIVDDMATRATGDQWDRLAELDLTFHETLVGATGSPRLARMFATLAAETRICLTNLADAYPQQNDLVAEHRHLVALLRTGTERQILTAIDEHHTSAVRDLTNPTNPGTPASGRHP
jgi:DNA-binding GntR family transcriptional regulator